eukprot:COSAG01_NODE_2756_length_7129_cov_15.029730_4_plen_187_part_00
MVPVLIECTVGCVRGAQLGLSWEAADVTVVRLPTSSTVPTSTPVTNPVTSVKALGAALRSALDRPGCSNECVFVQRYVAAACELRLFVVEGQVAGRYFARYDNIKHDGRPEAWVTKSREAVQAEWFASDAEALACAERQAEVLVDRWQCVLGALSVEPVPAIRMDFLIQRLAPGMGRAYTLELTGE